MKRTLVTRISTTLLIIFTCLTKTTHSTRVPKCEKGIVKLPLRPKHHLSTEKRRTEVATSGPLYQGLGHHYVDLWIGQPFRKRQTVAIDTTSQLTAVTCKGCNNCGAEGGTDGAVHLDPFYDFEMSKTFQKLNCSDCMLGKCGVVGADSECHIAESYNLTTSWKGYEVVDSAYVGGWHDTPEDCLHGEDVLHAESFAFPLVFACQQTVNGVYKTQKANGVMGLSNGDGSFFKQMYEHSMIPSPVFALCFTRMYNRGYVVDASAGVLALGGRDENIAKSPMVYAKNVRREGSYAVQVRNMFLLQENEWGNGDQTIRSYNQLKDDEVQGVNILDLNLETELVNMGEAVIDSLSPDTFFVDVIGTAFLEAFKTMVGVDFPSNPSQTIKIGQVDVKKLPTILLQLEAHQSNAEKYEDNPSSIPGLAGALDKKHRYDVIVALPPSRYLEPTSNTYLYRSKFIFTQQRCSVIGANLLAGHDVFFDVENSRLGFAQSDCAFEEVEHEFQNVTIPNPKEIAEAASSQAAQEMGKLHSSAPSQSTKEHHPMKLFLCFTSGILIGILLITAFKSFYAKYKNRPNPPYSRSDLDAPNDLTPEQMDLGEDYSFEDVKIDDQFHDAENKINGFARYHDEQSHRSIT